MVRLAFEDCRLTWSVHCSKYEYRDHSKLAGWIWLTSIFRNSVHFASSEGRGPTLLIFGAGILRLAL